MPVRHSPLKGRGGLRDRLPADRCRTIGPPALGYLNNPTTALAVSVGVEPTDTPAASSAAFFADAVPVEPDTIAPAWPIGGRRAS